MITDGDRTFLWRALDLAKISLENGTYPMGAILVGPDGMWEERNHVYENGCITAHAEMGVISNVGLRIMHGNYTLYTVMEPCDMCIAAIGRSPGIKQVFCLIEDTSILGGIRAKKPFSSRIRDAAKALGMDRPRAGTIVKLKRRSPAPGFVIQFLPTSSDLVTEAQMLWSQWLAVAATAKGKWN